MKIGRLLNVLAVNSELLADKVEGLGVHGFIEFLEKACAGCVLDGDRIREAANRKRQWGLVLIE